jgi:hypothetical protein
MFYRLRPFPTEPPAIPVPLVSSPFGQEPLDSLHNQQVEPPIAPAGIAAIGGLWMLLRNWNAMLFKLTFYIVDYLLNKTAYTGINP